MAPLPLRSWGVNDAPSLIACRRTVPSSTRIPLTTIIEQQYIQSHINRMFRGVDNAQIGDLGHDLGWGEVVCTNRRDCAVSLAHRTDGHTSRPAAYPRFRGYRRSGREEFPWKRLSNLGHDAGLRAPSPLNPRPGSCLLSRAITDSLIIRSTHLISPDISEA